MIVKGSGTNKTILKFLKSESLKIINITVFKSGKIRDV